MAPYLAGYKPCLNEQERTLLRVQRLSDLYHRACRIYRLDDEVLSGIRHTTTVNRINDNPCPVDLQGASSAYRKIMRHTTHAPPRCPLMNPWFVEYTSSSGHGSTRHPCFLRNAMSACPSATPTASSLCISSGEGLDRLPS